MFRAVSLAALVFTVSIKGMVGPVQAVEPLNDPMRPPVTLSLTSKTAKAVRGYELSSVFISANRRAAIINGRNVVVGDRVNGAKVLDIQASKVVISLSGKKRTLTLLPLSIKKPVEASRK